MDKTFTESFDKAFKMLNPKQKDAVIDFEGPMMVVAGPGTGKTQLLAIRIGYILKNTDAQAHNILALTYTEAGAIAMRQRLLKFIGPDAYKVNIFTFHAFCASVIRDNVEYFGGFRNLQAVSELEMDEVLRGIIDSFDYDHLLKRLSGNIYYDRSRLKNLFSTMKQEGWSKQDIADAIEHEFEVFKEDENNYYKRNGRGYKKGDLKVNDLEKLKKKFKELFAGVEEFEQYKDRLAQMERFDYNDMILWVIDVFRNHEEVLLDYQERYQYFLVDEYQDTNGSQNDLLFLLSNYWDRPNLFVVGDDDQSIYRFQGASMGNLLDFKDKFKPTIIVLENNYRSTQTILESSKQLIENNQERLVNTEGLDKNLIRSRNDNQEELDVHIVRYFNTVHEEKDIVDRIIRLHDNGYDLSKIAVIYRKHRNVENIIKYLNNKNIPLQIRREVNVLQSIEVQRVLKVIQYLQSEADRMHSAEDTLFKILHFEYFELKAKDIAKISIHCSRRTDDNRDDKRWRDVINNLELLKQLNLQEPEKIYAIGQLFERRISDIINDTPQVFFEKLFTENGILNTIMSSPDSTWRLQLINSFFNFIKEETTKDYTLSMKEIVEKIELMLDADIPLNLVKIAYSKSGVQFTTIHSSKGLEYDIVFLIKGDKTNWKPRNNQGNFSYPPSLTPSASLVNEEDDRRLFYVAMTRAKNELFLTYADSNEEGKKQEACSFIIELESDTDKHQFIALKDEKVTEYKYELMRYEQGAIELLDQDLIAQQLENFTLSATGLNKYLKCPLSFYFDNILRVPGARNKYNGFGSAMHYGLEIYFQKLKEDPTHTLPPKSDLYKFFEDGLNKYRSHFTKREYDDFLVYGKENLSLYFDKYSSSWSMAKDFHLEMKITDVAHKHVPINGMIDRVMEMDDGVFVFDYKTGKLKTDTRKKLKPPLGDDDNGGDYWRQIVFYSFLIKEYSIKNWKFLKGFMSFLEADKEKFHEQEYTISEMEQDIVSEQILHTYEGVMNHEFGGCNEPDCRWCTFVRSNGNSNLQAVEYDED